MNVTYLICQIVMVTDLMELKFFGINLLSIPIGAEMNYDLDGECNIDFVIIF